MTAIIILNVVFAAAVIVGIVGLLGRSIRDDNRASRWPAELNASPVHSVPRRRRSRARAHVPGRTADSRA
jgi:hypothetical protein